MAEVSLRSFLPFMVVSALLAYEEWASFPSCKRLPSGPGAESPEDLKVMMVSDLLLLGSEAGFVNHYFRDYYMSRFFRKSYQMLKPDMLLVLGDVSAEGSELTRNKWLSVFRQFHQVLGPFLALPFHATLGDRDVGDCTSLDAKSVNWLSRSFPGLDSAGCGAFEISNITFVSLNAVALLCNNNDLRFNIEKAIERESVHLQMGVAGAIEANDVSLNSGENSHKFRWRGNTMASGSGPVLLLHFPLHHAENNYHLLDGILEGGVDVPGYTSNIPESRYSAETGPYDLSLTLPPNATEYIFQALKPRIIFSAHNPEFGDHTHVDGTREITVPAMSWKARDDPGFILATFQNGRTAINITYCSLARESHLLIAYTFLMVVILSQVVLPSSPGLGILKHQ